MERLFVCSTSEMVEVGELMRSRHVLDHEIAIDALRGWCIAREETSFAPLGKNFYDQHHYYNRANGRGPLGRKWREQHTELLRRDIHESLEAHFGWLVQPYPDEIEGVA